jgi:hypothetical protein
MANMSVEISRAYRAAYDYRTIREGLLAVDPTLGEDEQALLDTLEGCTDLREAISEIARSAKADKALAFGLSDLIDTLHARKARLERRAEKKRAIVLQLMSENDIKKITAPDHTISRKPTPPSVIITNENLIPERLQKITRTPNKTAIKAALANGDEVPGAELSNGGETISITT